MKFDELNAEAAQYAPSTSALAARFRYWHVESLLNQAADLFDRALRERDEALSLQSQNFQFQLEHERLQHELNYEKSRLFKSKTQSLAFDEIELSKMWFGNYYARLESAAALAQKHSDESPGDRPRSISAHRASADFSNAQVENEKRNAEIVRYAIDNAEVENSIRLRQEWLERYSALLLRGKPTSLEERISRKLERVIGDFKDGFDRALTASNGLKLIYGASFPPPLKDGDVSRFDLSVRWVRSMITWLVATLQYEQVFTQHVLLRSLVGEERWTLWKTDLSAGRTAEFRFTLPLPDLPFRYVRLRGFSVVAHGSSILLSAKAKLPAKGQSLQHDKDNDAIQILDQSSLPECFIGRIESHESLRPPELCGANSLANSSPYGGSDSQGAWSFSIEQKSINSTSELSDLGLELILAGIPV